MRNPLRGIKFSKLNAAIRKRIRRFQNRKPSRNLSLTEKLVELDKKNEVILKSRKSRELSQIEQNLLKVKYTKIRTQILAFLEKENLSLNNVVFVGNDIGGRIPALVVRKALNLPFMQFVRVSFEKPDYNYIANAARNGKWKGKTVIFVDSTINSGHQVRSLKDFFDSRTVESLGIKGWKLMAHGELADLNIDYGFDKAKGREEWYFFEDRPNVIGVNQRSDAALRLMARKGRQGETPSEVAKGKKILFKRD
ncbi:phosphoribosyltransferase domain-containing protein [Candidatus Micrarchaeota archaeon]|nr:phosphoribosyltransferase domain-containing protein [Candidatus Micrarchaeota archaeon]MBU2476047.1 phosphoribosyltransferase domain-containing protein [Candidatus Micrarchaeota archaeon]